MKWQFDLPHVLPAPRLLSKRFMLYKLGIAGIGLLCTLSNALANDSAGCINTENTSTYVDNLPECSEIAFNVPLLESSPRVSGPESSDSNLDTISTAQKIELERLTVLATQAEAASKTSKISKAEQANAAWVLGLLMLHGRGVPPDTKRAKYWFQIAWQQGEKKASAGLAWCEMVGCGMPADLAKARYWRAQLFSINRGRSLYFEWLSQQRAAPLAAMNGLGINYDKLPHRSLLIQAANAGDIQAHIELGIESASKKQLDEALDHFLFAEKNSTIASNNAHQIRAEIADLKSQSKLQPPTSDNLQSAESTLALAHRYHRGEGMPVNYSEAIRLYRKAADLGSPQAKKMLNLIFSQPLENGQINIPWMQSLSYMDISGSTPKLSADNGPFLLTREETGLTDFIPQYWNKPLKLHPNFLRPCQPQSAPC
jgi:TPR repeat protein